ncbi:hypothetical protein CIG75_02575 [Tumebacillus algifaecis]|uniref:Uncharacterized protein n=1 Tax=Tumebacillus algifaecis TaxID=1214604 RepID=A0A223CXQ5_9BACL|nr:hypothetical protein [Tumebacillus algifaecis]ASS73974.1 hypothetical protein CIG75_02575 [Tumebacillus algifaecis]
MDNLKSNLKSGRSGVFIGARNLNDEVYNILPTFDLLLKQIEQIREQSYNEMDSNESGTNFKKDVNNTIGIFGARGTGKTSVLYTLINKLLSSGNEVSALSSNMVMGIIEPDHFGDNTKIMGSIVGFLKNAVEQQLKKIESLGQKGKVKGLHEYFNKGMLRSNNRLRSSLNELIEYHMYTENEYRQLLMHTYDDLATHINKSSRLLTPDIEFKNKLHQLITILVDNHRYVVSNSSDGSELVGEVHEPLLFVFVDDIDLKMVRSRELMEAILQYANHPHVVTVLSGDYDILLESVTLALLQDENLKWSNITPRFKANNQVSIKDRKQNLAHEYIKKIMPPARRHQLLQWNENNIPNFSFDKRTLMEQLDKLLGSKNLFSYQLEGSSKLYPITKSFSIFDRTPRGIVNVYYHIHEMNERFAELWRVDRELSEQEKKERFTLVKSLVDTILLSSTELAAEQRGILEKFIQWGQDASNTFLDYSYIQGLQNKSKARGTSKQNASNQKNALNQQSSTNDDSNQSSSSQGTNLIIPLLIVGEMIRSLLDEVRLDQGMCDELQVSALLGILQLDTWTTNKYGHVVRDMLSFISFQNALIMTNRLLDKKEWLVQPYDGESEKATFWKEKLDRLLLTEINKIVSVGKEENLLSRLFYAQYVGAKQSGPRIKYVGLILDFLKEASNTTEDLAYYKSLYEYPIMDGPWVKLQSWFENTEFAQELFINFIVEINSWDAIVFENKFKESQGHHIQPASVEEETSVSAKLKKILIAIRRKQQKNEKFTPAQKNRIDNLIKQFYDSLFSKLRKELERDNFVIEWKDNKTIVNAISDFKLGRPDGLTETTKYKQTKRQIESTIEERETYVQYSKRRYELQGLANNYNVWFGRREAELLLQTMKQQAYMAPSNLLPDELWVLRHLADYLNQVHTAVQRDADYEKVKEEMRHKLAEGFNEAKNLVETDLSDLGIDLEEDEESDANA